MQWMGVLEEFSKEEEMNMADGHGSRYSGQILHQ